MEGLTLYGREKDARTSAARAALKLSGLSASVAFEAVEKEVKKNLTFTNRLPILKRGDDAVAFSGAAIVSWSG